LAEVPAGYDCFLVCFDLEFFGLGLNLGLKSLALSSVPSPYIFVLILGLAVFESPRPHLGSHVPGLVLVFKHKVLDNIIIYSLSYAQK